MLRKLVFAFVLLAACSAAVSAAAAAPTLTLAPSAYKVLYGHKLMLSGRLGGGSLARVSIMAVPYGQSAPTKVATVRTDASGQFTVAVRPKIETTYRAHWSTIDSSGVTVGVTPSTSIRELGNGHIWTRVTAGSSFDRRFVKLQTMSSGTWQTVAQKRLSTASVAVFSTRLPTSSVRVTMSVNQAGAGYLATASHALGYKAYALTINARSFKVLYGHKLILSGQLLNARGGQTITVDAWIRELGNGNVWAHVQGLHPFAGKVVKLQQLTVGGAWLTVAQHPLNAKSATIFAMALPTSSIRVAMSVNQAGVGLLGTMSHPLAYHTV